MSKKIYGLHKRENSRYYQTNYTVPGTKIRLRCSTGETAFEDAVRWTEIEIRKIRDEVVYGQKPVFTFHNAATRYLDEYEGTKPWEAVRHTDLLMKYLDNMPLEDIYLNRYSDNRKDGCPELISLISDRLKDGKKKNTINRPLEILRRIIHLAAFEWRHNGKTWLEKPNLIRLLKLDDVTPSIYLTWEKQKELMNALPDLNADMIQYKVNTGCRMTEVCRLQWSHEVNVIGVDRPVFVIPPYDNYGVKLTKNKKHRVVILNDLALAVINRRRGKNDEFVFAKPNGEPFNTMRTTAFKTAREKLKLGKVTIHGLKRTFASRLRDARVPKEDIRFLLAHSIEDISDHYTEASIGNLHYETINRLIEEVNKVVPGATAPNTGPLRTNSDTCT